MCFSASRVLWSFYVLFLWWGRRCSILYGSLESWPVIARLTYGETLAIRKKPYLDAAKLNGASDRQILMGEVLPNASAPIWAALAFRVSRAILSESSLSFLGV